MTDVVGRVIIITDDVHRRGGILYALLMLLFGVLYVLLSCRPEQIVCVQDAQYIATTLQHLIQQVKAQKRRAKFAR